MSDGKIPYRNHEGYPDPTAHDALTNVMREYERQQADQRFASLIREIKGTIEHSGFELMARIKIKDKQTGKVYR